MTIKLVDAVNRGPELMKYGKVVDSVNLALDDVVDGRRTAIDVLQLIDYLLFANKLSTYRDCNSVKPDDHVIRNFNHRMCKGCNYRIPYNYIVNNGLEKSLFYYDGTWYRISKEEGDNV